jgi:hypothetical protein
VYVNPFSLKAVAGAVVQLFLFLGTFLYVPVILGLNVEGNQLLPSTLVFARISLLSQACSFG